MTCNLVVGESWGLRHKERCALLVHRHVAGGSCICWTAGHVHGCRRAPKTACAIALSPSLTLPLSPSGNASDAADPLRLCMFDFSPCLEPSGPVLCHAGTLLSGTGGAFELRAR
jgi:hypothetical protein